MGGIRHGKTVVRIILLTLGLLHAVSVRMALLQFLHTTSTATEPSPERARQTPCASGNLWKSVFWSRMAPGSCKRISSRICPPLSASSSHHTRWGARLNRSSPLKTPTERPFALTRIIMARREPERFFQALLRFRGKSCSCERRLRIVLSGDTLFHRLRA